MTMSDTNSATKEHSELIKNELASAANDIYADIEKGGGFSFTQRLPLNLFEEHFLRYFKGEVESQEEKDFCFSKWSKVAGHLGTPVDIFNSEDKIVFTIPALHDGNLLDPSKAEAIEFALRQSQHHAARSPTAAVAYLIKNGKKIADNIKVDNIEQRKHDLWVGFWEYYGIIGKKEGSSSGPAVQNDVSPEDDFEFE